MVEATVVAAPAKSAKPAEPRNLLLRYLVGSGIEIGPGHTPMPVLYPGVSIKYVDRWEPNENEQLFPELEDASFVKPDVIANLDTDRLSAFTDRSLDFVIASHVGEHVADPLGLLADIYRVLRPGGVALILLPDRRFSFDSERQPTKLEQLISEHVQGVTSVSDDQIREFIRVVEGLPETAERIADHRKRSIHVHCWSEEEFVQVLEHTITAMNMSWELLDAIFVEEVADSFEFGFVLQRAIVDAVPEVAAERLRLAIEAMEEHAKTVPVAETQRVRAERAEAKLKKVLGSRSWRATEPLRRLFRYVR